MKAYQHDFIEFALETGVLQLGEFTLKSGRISPYFFNSGLFNSGASLARLGQFYAQAIVDSDLQFDTLYGPAYKGIPLAATTVVALAEHHKIDMPYTFNRKEIKDHGEGGQLVGAPLTGNILIIDDVISAGTSIRESISIIKSAKAIPAGVIIALDRQERGQDTRSAIQQVELDYQIPVINIVSLHHLLTYLNNQPSLSQHRDAILAYQQAYGV